MNKNDYALIQNKDGTTILNSKRGKSLHIRQNNTDRMVFDSSGNVEASGKLTTKNGMNITGGRSYFKDSENKGRVRVGAAWGIPGLYSEDGQDIVVGVASNKSAHIGTNGKYLSVSGDGNVSAKGNVEASGKLTTKNGMNITGGRSYFKDSENKGRVRVGAAWGIPGLYSEDGQDIVVGVASNKSAHIGTSGKYLSVAGNGNISAKGNFETTGNIKANKYLDKDGKEINNFNPLQDKINIGKDNSKLKLGNVGHNNWAGIAHSDRMNKNDYALIQNKDGTTILNSKGGKDLHIRQGNVDRMIFDSSGNVDIKNKITSRPHFSNTDIYLDNSSRRGGKGGSSRRALVHDVGDKLTLNYANDYTGGIKLSSNVETTGNLLPIGGIINQNNQQIISSDKDWLRIGNNTNPGKTAMYGNVSINDTKNGNSGLSVGAWKSVGQGNIEATGSIKGNKLCIGNTCIDENQLKLAIYNQGYSVDYYNYNNNKGKSSFIFKEIISGKTIDYSWKSGNVLNSGKSNDIWLTITGFIYINQTKNNLQFKLSSDDGSRLYINNQQIISMWQDQGTTSKTSGNVAVTKGQLVPFQIDYWENGGHATLKLEWNMSGSFKVIPSSNYRVDYLK